MARRTLRRATGPQTLRTPGYTAAQCLEDSRELFSDMITYLLRRTSGIRGAKMMWTLEELAMTQKVIYAFGVFLFGWPPDIPFQSPGQCTLRQLERLLLGVRRHQIYFVRVSPEEVQALEFKHGISNFQGRRARSDAWTRAPLRPPETRSGHLRKAPIKTLPWLPTDADTKEVDWDEWMATYQPNSARRRK